MFGLETIADSFDRMHAEAQKTVDDGVTSAGQWSGDTFGPDSGWNWVFAIPTGIAYSIATFTMASGKGLVDVLRLGEGVKSGTAGGVASDALRIASILPAVGMIGKTGGMIARTGGAAVEGSALLKQSGMILNATQAAAGDYQMSCGVTSSVVAVRLGGIRRLVTLDELGAYFGKGSPMSPGFPGVSWSEVTQVLPQVGARAQQIGRAGMTLADIETAAQQGRGTVVFGVGWTGGGRHILAAFRNTQGQVVVADQFGVRFLSDLGRIGGQSAAYTLTGDALLVENVGFVQRMETLRQVGAATKGLGSAAEKSGAAFNQSAAARTYLTGALGIETVILPWARTWSIDSAIRDALGRPPRNAPAVGDAAGTGGGPAPGGAAPGLPGASAGAGIAGPLPPDAARLLAALPPKGKRTRQDVQQAAGLTGSRFYEAVQLLERRGLVTVTRFGQDELNISSLERR